MLKIAIASLFTKNTKYASNAKIEGPSGTTFDGWGFYY